MKKYQKYLFKNNGPFLRMDEIAKVLLWVSLFSFNATAQNLVPNGDFEEYDQCPTWSNQFNGYVADWSIPFGVNNYYNACGHTNTVNFPSRNNSRGNTTFITYRRNSNNNPRTYLRNQLLRPLLPGELVYVSYWIYDWGGRSFYAEDFSVYFSDTLVTKQLEDGKKWIDLPAQVNWTGGIIRDTGVYVPITGCFVAEGGEKYITLGNFKHPDSMRLDSMHVRPQGNILALDDVKIISEGTVAFADSFLCPGEWYRWMDPYDMNMQARSLVTGEVLDSFIMPNERVDLEIFLPECGVVDTITIRPEDCADCFVVPADINICILDSIAMDSLLLEDTELVIAGEVFQRGDLFYPTTDTSYWAVYRSAYCDTIELIEIEIGSCASCSPEFSDTSICPGDVFELEPYRPFDLSLDGTSLSSDTLIYESGFYSILLSTQACDTVTTFQLEVRDCISCSDVTDTLPVTHCPGEVFALDRFEGYDVYLEGRLLAGDTLLEDAGVFGIVLGSEVCDTLASFNLIVDSCQNCIPALELDEVDICINEEIPTDVFSTEGVYALDTPDLTCPGVHTIRAGHESCRSWKDSITLLVIADRDCYSFSLNDSLCEGESVVLESDASLQVELSEQFEFNGGYKQKLLFTDVNCPQISFEEAVTIFNCKECRYAIPNIFSPNRDGVNDIFSISVNCPLAQFEAEIYDRWGSLLYRSKDPNRIWNGTGAQSGTYVYRIRMQLFNGRSVESIIETGTITLVM